MKHFVKRTCTVVREHEKEPRRPAESSLPHVAEPRPLESFRDESAYVLLGPPGSGKTVAFEHEAAEWGHYITARDFLTLDPEADWEGKTLFIDGLDEMRAGASGGRTPFDAIRAKLQRLGRPPFRLSCRAADWFGANDRERLGAVAPNREVRVLQLDSLSENGILEILARNHGVDDPAAFVAKARKRGVEDLLRNPQNLRMLAEAVAETDEWPRTRAETFAMACRKLVSEENPEHQIAWSGTVDMEALLDRAGDLCALLLLAGKAGVTLPATMSDTNHPRLDQVPRGNQQLLRRVVGTNLFAMPSEGRMATEHRQIAEFLAARHLAARIADGVPVRRMLSLMTGFDGGIISEFRGLAAWLAALSHRARAEIIERDPLGVVLYGDVQQFGPHEKRLLFQAMKREIDQNPWLVPYTSSDSPLRSLVGPELEDDMRQALTHPARDETHQSFVLLVAEAIRDAAPFPELAVPLMAIVRDDSWQPTIRCAALEAYIRARQDDPRVSVTLRQLLEEVYTGVVTTHNDDLLGTLLTTLYPDDLPVPDLVGYLREPPRRNLWTRYWVFWTDRLIEKSTTEQMVELLDLLRVPIEQVRADSGDGPKGVDLTVRPPIVLLRHLLTHSPKSVSLEQLLYWLDFAGWLGRELSFSAAGAVSDAEFFRNWLGGRLDIQKAMIVDCARRWPEERRRFETGLHRTPQSPPPPTDGRFDRFREYAKANAAALRANRCPPSLLHHLALAYFDGFADVGGKTPEDRLRYLLGADDDLLGAALAGLWGATDRADLPKWTEVGKLAAEGRVHFLAYPFMVGLEKLTRAPETRDLRLREAQTRLALVIHFAVPRMRHSDNSKRPPGWLRISLERQPDVVAEVWTHCARAQLRRGEQSLDDAHRMAREPGYAQLARVASVPLLKAFPVRCRAGQLPILRSLLGAALSHGDRTQLLELIEAKLAYKSMNSGQRVNWLTAGLFAKPEAYGERLESYVSGRSRRIGRLVEAGFPHASGDLWDATVLERLIRLIGPYTIAPPNTGGVCSATWPIQTDWRLHSFIDRLSEDTSDAAGNALESLAADDRLLNRRSELLDRLHRQKSIRREATFAHPGLEQVAEVLDNGRPANAADLASLTTDILARIARDIRDGASSGWREFWNVDSYGRVTHPRPENRCRDTLVGMLRSRVAVLGVEVQSEARYADEKRSDIRVSCSQGGFNVPGEIKKSCHRDLWSAIHSQLIAKYTRDPDADGHGIYLVFWFGEAEDCRPTPRSGPRPTSPAELQQALLDTFTETQRRKISVAVIDVSKPEP